MGSALIARHGWARRALFIVLWVAASTTPSIVGFAAGRREILLMSTPYLAVAAVGLGTLQGLTLAAFFERGLLWKWLAATVPLVLVAPLVGVVVGVAVYLVLAAVSLLSPANAPLNGDQLFVAVFGFGFIGGGAPAVLVQWRVLRSRVGRRWLWTLPVPGLTYGLTYYAAETGHVYVASGDPVGVAFATALALVYGLATATAIAPAVGERAASG